MIDLRRAFENVSRMQLEKVLREYGYDEVSIKLMRQLWDVEIVLKKSVEDVFHVLAAIHHFSSLKQESRALRHLETAHGWVVTDLLQSGLRNKLKEMWLSWLGRKKNSLAAIRTEVTAAIQKLVGAGYRVLRKRLIYGPVL